MIILNFGVADLMKKKNHKLRPVIVNSNDFHKVIAMVGLWIEIQQSGRRPSMNAKVP